MTDHNAGSIGVAVVAPPSSRAENDGDQCTEACGSALLIGVSHSELVPGRAALRHIHHSVEIRRARGDTTSQPAASGIRSGVEPAQLRQQAKPAILNGLSDPLARLPAGS